VCIVGGASATTRRGPDEHAAADLVQLDFTVTAPDQLWMADITCVPTRAGLLILEYGQRLMPELHGVGHMSDPKATSS
jgi:hypothetical protein